MGQFVTFRAEEVLRVVKQRDIIVVHFSCILVSAQQILPIQLFSLST
jgi:hypothetical protein